MADILKKVSLEYSLDDIKKIMKLLVLNNAEVMNAYDAMRKIVNDNGKVEYYDDLIITFFKSYIKRLDNIGLQNINDEILKKDYELIKTSKILQNPSSAKELFLSDDFRNLKIKPMSLQGESFTHIHGSYINNFSNEEIECRFYLSPRMENVASLVKQIIIKHAKENLPCYFKFSNKSERNDRIVLYSSLDNADKHLRILEEIKKENPQLFAQSNKNLLWGNIRGVEDIYFGMEPFYKGVSSYGAIRGAILDETLCDFQRLYGYFSENEEITDDMANKYKQLLNFNCILNGIDQKNFVLNKTNRFATDVNSDKIVLSCEDGTELPIYIRGGSFKNNTATITNDCSGFGQYFEIPIEQLDLLYKRNKDDEKYAQSEYVRKQTALEFKKLIRKTTIKERFDKFNLKKIYENKRIVQVSKDGKVRIGDGEIDYKLYMILPRRISQLITKLKVQKQNRNMYIINPEITEEIAIINNQISDINQDVIKETIEMVQQERVKGLTYEEIKSDDPSLYRAGITPVEEVMKTPEKFIIPECIDACRILWDKGIDTVQCGNYDDPVENGFWIEIDSLCLSEENRNIFNSLVNTDNRFSYHGAQHALTLRVDRSSCASQELCCMANLFSLQDTNHFVTEESFLDAYKRTGGEQYIDAYGYIERKINPEYENAKLEEALIKKNKVELYSEEEGRIYESVHALNVHLNYINKTNNKIR